MPTLIEPYTIFDHGYVVRIQPPTETDSKQVLLLLHGWTGDEKVMWVFTRSLPTHYWIFAPRGPVKSPVNGYGWAMVDEGQHQRYGNIVSAIPPLLHAVDSWLKDLKVETQSLNLMGFSQGAALAYSLLIEQPDRILKTAALAGSLPEGTVLDPHQKKLIGKQIFVAHGTQDTTIPVEAARRSVEILESAGANVTYCEDNTGHKLGAACHRGLVNFFS